MSWQPTPSNLFFSKGDPSDPRLGELSKSIQAEQIKSLAKSAQIILGYPDDEGIRLNGGRPGAALAPDRIRQFLYKMTPSVLAAKAPALFDLGNLTTELNLLARHGEAEKLAQELCEQELFFYSLGGGHDYGYPDAAGFIKAQIKSGHRPLVINFDAHLDVRPMVEHPHSGTPFYRLLNDFHGQFDFLEVGLQNHCNAKTHLQWAKDHGARFLFLDEIKQGNLFSQINALVDLKKQNLFLSLDMDCVRSSEAPGCSASYPTGISAAEIISALEQLKTQGRVKGLGIYEVSPPLDENDRTSKLAALIIHRLIHIFAN